MPLESLRARENCLSIELNIRVVDLSAWHWQKDAPRFSSRECYWSSSRVDHRNIILTVLTSSTPSNDEVKYHARLKETRGEYCDIEISVRRARRKMDQKCIGRERETAKAEEGQGQTNSRIDGIEFKLVSTTSRFKR